MPKIKCAFKDQRIYSKHHIQEKVQSSPQTTLNATTISLSLHAPQTHSGQFSFKCSKDVHKVKEKKKDMKHKISRAYLQQDKFAL